MKAIILERRGEEVAVLREDGIFARARHAGEIGETFEISEKVVAFPEKKRSGWMRGAVAAMLALALTGGTLGYMGGTASAYVSLDVGENSAIELTLNHFGRVIAVNALGENAEALAETLSGEVRHYRAKDALDITMAHLRDEGYLDDASGAVIVGVATDNGRRATELRELAEQAIERDGEHTAYVSELSRAEREQAMEQNTSTGRFGLTRDHQEIPTQDGDASEAKDEPEQPAPPAIPANGTESGVFDTQPPQNGEQGASEQNQPPQNGEQDAPEQNQLPQDGEQGAPGQDQPPQNGEQPESGQNQPPQDGEQGAPEQNQPPQDGEQGAPKQNQPPQDGEQGAPEENQLPQDGEQGAPGQDQPPQNGEQGAPGQDQPPQNGGQDKPVEHESRG